MATEWRCWLCTPVPHASAEIVCAPPMSELIGWLMVLGLVVAIVCIFLLSSQLEQHMRSNAEMLLRSNEMILARLERLANPPHEATESTIGVVLERRNFPR